MPEGQPMQERWQDAQTPRWQRLEALLKVPSHLASSKDLQETSHLYWEILNALARARSTPEAHYLEPYLNRLAQQCHIRLYQNPRTSRHEVSRFFKRDFPQAVYQNRFFILAAALMFGLGTILALLTLHFDPSTQHYFLPKPIIEGLKQGILWTDHTQAHPAESSYLMTNNIRVALNAYALGLLFGVGTLILLLHNGMFAFGGPLGVCLLYGMGDRLLNFILPHSILELTTIFIAGGAGMRVGWALLLPGTMARWDAVRQRARESMVLILGCVPLLVVAGLIEGMVSLNQQLASPIRILVAGFSAVGLLAYLGINGQPQHEAPTEKPPAGY